MTSVASPAKSHSTLSFSLFRSKKKINGTVSNDTIKTAVVEPQPVKKEKRAKKVDSKTLPSSNPERKKKGRHKSSFWDTKSMSLDDLDLDVDPNYLVEALETIGDEQPTVARSIPKHAKVTKREDKSMKNCLFEQDVYDLMLSDSLKVCDMLQSHLDDCITSVRAKSPETVLDISHDGADSGRGASSASSTISTAAPRKPLKSCVRADV